MIHEVILTGALLFHPQAEKDSIGTETIDGKMYIIHRVDEKETLFAISRRYGSSVESILQSNPGATTSLEIGQIIKVPYDKKVSVRPVEGSKIHTVAAKETMYSISKTYNVSIEDLRKWNNLTDNTLSIGQQLIVGKTPAVEVRQDPARTTPPNRDTPVVVAIPESGVHTVGTKETLFSIARQYGLSVAQLRSWNSLEGDELQVGQVIRLKEMKNEKPLFVKPCVSSSTERDVQLRPSQYSQTTRWPPSHDSRRIISYFSRSAVATSDSSVGNEPRPSSSSSWK